MDARSRVRSVTSYRPRRTGWVGSLRNWLAIGLSVVTATASAPADVMGQGPTEAPPASLSVAIDIPGSPRMVPLGMPQVVTVRVQGAHAIDGVELWANDEPLVSLPVDGTATAFVVGWQWTPDEPGDVVLFARGSDADGAAGQSNALHLRVVDQARRGGRTRSKPDRTSTSTTDSGTVVGQGARPEVEVAGCRIRLAPAPMIGGHRSSLYHLNPSDMAFAKVMTLAPTDGVETVELPVGPGLHLLVQSDVDGDAETFGPPVAVDVPADCGRVGWSGEMRLVEGRLRVPASVDRGYLYLQVDGGPAVRVPSDPRTFVTARDGFLDFGPFLPRLAGEVLTAEAWGWAGNRLKDLGSGRLRMSKARAATAPDRADAQQPGFVRPVELGLADLVGFASATALDIVVVKGGGEFQPVLARQVGLPFPTTPAGLPITRTLRWTTDLTGVTSVIWQVLPYPPGTAADVAPPFAIDLWSTAVEQGVTTGDATLDFSLYLEHPVSVAQAVAGLPEMQPVILGDPWLPGAPTPTAKPSAVSQALGPTANLTEPETVQTPVAFMGDFYVRVVPMAGATPLAPSNFVRLSVTEPEAPIKIDWQPCDTCTSNPGALQIAWSFTLPAPANPTYTACAVVTGFAADYVSPPGWWPWTYKVGKVLCPDPPDDDGWSLMDAFEAAFEFVTTTWDFVSSSYDWVKQQVVSVVLTAVPCQAIADESVCEGLANIALDAVAVGFGVPPSIPDYSSTMQALKGDVVDFVVKNAAEQFPAIAAACDIASAGAAVSDDLKDCRDLVGMAVDETVKHIEAARSEAAGAATGKAWPGVLFAPDPRGQWQPPTLTITATRTNDPVQPKVCAVTGAMTSELAGWEWPELVAGKVVSASGTVKGTPLLGQTVALPQLAPGESVTRTVYLSDSTTWFESKDSFEYWYYAKALAYPNRAWVLLQQGAQLTFTVSSNCAPTSSVGPVTLPASATGP